jgi:AraC-like DNA-binding protein
MLRWQKSYFFKPDDFPLTILHAREHSSYPLHTHEFTEIVIVGQGEAKHITDFGTYEISEGDVFVIVPGEKHGYQCGRKKFELYNIIFDYQAFEKCISYLKKEASFNSLFTLEPKLRQKGKNIKKMKLSPYQLTIVKDLLSRIQDELNAKRTSYQDMCRALFTELLVFICRCYEKDISATRSDLIKIARVLEFIEKNYARKFYQRELLKICNMSRSTFQRVFLKTMGIAPLEYLIKVRLTHAIDLIASRRYNITEAAYETGFSDSNYFSRVFRKCFKTSPSMFIRKYNSTSQKNSLKPSKKFFLTFDNKRLKREHKCKRILRQ